MVDNDGMWYDKEGTDDDGELEWMDREFCVFDDRFDVTVDETDECKLDLVDCDLLGAVRCAVFACDDCSC